MMFGGPASHLPQRGPVPPRDLTASTERGPRGRQVVWADGSRMGARWPAQGSVCDGCNFLHSQLQLIMENFSFPGAGFKSRASHTLDRHYYRAMSPSPLI